MIEHPRLNKLDATQLARDTVREALDAVHSQLFAIAPLGNYTLTVGESLEGSNLGHAVRVLCTYAQKGGELDASVEEYCITLIPVAGEALDDQGQPDPATPLGLVVSAALCREAITLGRPVSIARLAALSSLGRARLHQLAAAGELALTDGEVTAAEARRWLSGRGVAV